MRDCLSDFTIRPQNAELSIAAVVHDQMRRMGGLSGEREARARLIAAAPDMFEALLAAERADTALDVREGYGEWEALDARTRELRAAASPLSEPCGGESRT